MAPLEPGHLGSAGLLPGLLPGPAVPGRASVAATPRGQRTHDQPTGHAVNEDGRSARSLVVVEYVSLDGVIQAPGHADEDRDGGFAHGGWTGRAAGFMADHRRRNSQLFPTAGAFLLGRRTYEIFAAHWPAVTDENDRIADALNSRPKYVVSATLGEAAWPGTTVLTGDVPGQVAKLKQEPGGPVLVLGSATLVHA